jgi:hypothetical protein
LLRGIPGDLSHGKRVWVFRDPPRLVEWGSYGVSRAVLDRRRLGGGIASAASARFPVTKCTRIVLTCLPSCHQAASCRSLSGLSIRPAAAEVVRASCPLIGENAVPISGRVSTVRGSQHAGHRYNLHCHNALSPCRKSRGCVQCTSHLRRRARFHQELLGERSMNSPEVRGFAMNSWQRPLHRFAAHNDARVR